MRIHVAAHDFQDHFKHQASAVLSRPTQVRHHTFDKHFRTLSHEVTLRLCAMIVESLLLQCTRC